VHYHEGHGSGGVSREEVWEEAQLGSVGRMDKCGAMAVEVKMLGARACRE
jgi:hypothetical protein